MYCKMLTVLIIKTKEEQSIYYNYIGIKNFFIYISML